MPTSEPPRARIERARAELGAPARRCCRSSPASAGTQPHAKRRQVRPLSLQPGLCRADISYDLDLFGAARAGKRAARERFRAALFDRDAAALVVEAEVARAWVQYCALADRIALLDRSIDDARELERIINVRFREGAATKVDTGLQAIETRNLEAERLRLVEARQRTRNALALLVGEEAPLFNVADGRLADLQVPALAPSSRANCSSAARTCAPPRRGSSPPSGDVDAARRAFLPEPQAFRERPRPGRDLEQPDRHAPSRSAPACSRRSSTAARLDGRLHVAAADQHESVELYRKTLLTALKESEDALAGAARSAERERLIADVVANAETTARLSRMQYLEGDADLRTVLDAKRLLVQAEDARALVLQERLNAAADLYEAMGGVPQGAVYAGVK